jgi:NADPH-dependent curcumin reductase CurA
MTVPVSLASGSKREPSTLPFTCGKGLESAPDALLAVLASENFGQAVVRISPEP